MIRKSSVETPGTPVVTGFRNLVSGDTGIGLDSPQPATDMDPSVADGYIDRPRQPAVGQIDLRRITDPGGTPSISANQTLTCPPRRRRSPSRRRARRAGSTRSMTASSRRWSARGPDGTDTLWTAHNIRVLERGGDGSSGNRDAARWYQIGDLGSDPPTLAQSGHVCSTPRPPIRAFFWMPSIAMNGQGHASLKCSTAGSGRQQRSLPRLTWRAIHLGTTEGLRPHPVEQQQLRPGLVLAEAVGRLLPDGRRPDGRSDLLDLPGVRQLRPTPGVCGSSS